MRISPAGIELIQEFEKCRLEIYQDQAGFSTVGWGHKLTPSELSSGKIVIANLVVRCRPSITQLHADALFRQDLYGFEACVNETVSVDLLQRQFDALVSLAYNIGSGAFAGSTLLKRLNQKQFDIIPDQIRRWKYTGAKVSNGLVKRREAEVKLWSGFIENLETKGE